VFGHVGIQCNIMPIKETCLPYKQNFAHLLITSVYSLTDLHWEAFGCKTTACMHVNAVVHEGSHVLSFSAFCVHARSFGWLYVHFVETLLQDESQSV
jgi:hypothetical protein